jgi:uncharacterized cupredoxin-like copper-binding protein
MRLRRTRALAVLAAVAMLSACSTAAADEVDREVVLTEMAIGTSTDWAPGEQVLEVVNDGGAHHNLIICPGDASGCTEGGVGMELLEKPDVRDERVVPDRTSSLVVGSGARAVVRTDALEEGSHRLWCAIPNHAARGMELVVDVG